MKALQALGWQGNEKDIQNAEGLRTIAMDFVLGRIQQTKGAISEKGDLF
jgi:hypothetical protein